MGNQLLWANKLRCIFRSEQQNYFWQEFVSTRIKSSQPSCDNVHAKAIFFFLLFFKMSLLNPVSQVWPDTKIAADYYFAGCDTGVFQANTDTFRLDTKVLLQQRLVIALSHDMGYFDK